MPLIYSGQEEPFLDSISFFYKDTILFNKFERASFYQTLLQLRSSNPALAANASFAKEKIGNEKAIYAFTRSAGGKRILVITNLSNQPQTVSITNTALHGKATDVFTKAAVSIDANTITLNPWDYKVYAY
jgi:glycosidase